MNLVTEKMAGAMERDVPVKVAIILRRKPALNPHMMVC